MKKVSQLLLLSLLIWLLPIVGGIYFSLKGGWHLENFGAVFVGLNGFSPVSIMQEDSLSGFTLIWSICTGAGLIIFHFLALKLNNWKLALGAIGFTLLLFAVGIFRMMAHLSTIR